MFNPEKAFPVVFVLWVVWTVLCVGVVGWVLFQLITDPAGVAQAVGSFFGAMSEGFDNAK